MIEALAAKAISATSAAARSDGEATFRAYAALSTISALSDRASFGAAEKALLAVAERATDPDVRTEARLLARGASGTDGSTAAAAANAADGIAQKLVLIGPFRDTGGGIKAKEGPEDENFANLRGRYAWGSVDVYPRPVPASYALARGVPLDVFVAPRKESCSYLATTVTTDGAPFVVRVASAGQLRATFDGKEIGISEVAHGAARFDRLAAKVTANAGPHLLAMKVCTGAIMDAGRVRVRFTDENGAPKSLATSFDLGGARPDAAATITRIPTVVERATGTEKAETHDVEALLARATLRTLGGIDDLRSPRAPGLLDQIFHGTQAAATVAPDTLAFAAWVSPNGANRSGFFEVARRAAVTKGDKEAERFVGRRKLAEHIGAGLFDWAMIERKSSGIDAANDAEALLVAAMIDGQSGMEPIRVAAFRKLVERFRADRARAPMALLGELLGQSRTLDRRVFQEVTTEYERRGFRGSFAVEAALQSDRAARAKAAEEAMMRLDGADEGVGVIRLAASAGDWDTAYATAKTMALFAPNRAEVFTQLSRAAAATEGTAGKATVEAALRRARELDPGDGKVRAELAFRANPPGAPSKTPEKTENDKYLVASDVLLARRRGVPEGQPITEEEREIYWLRSVHMEPDGRVSQLIQYGKEVVIAPQTEDELYENLPLEGDYFEIVRARVHRKGGGIAYPVEEFNDGRRPRIRWPELAPGDVTEVVIKSWTSQAVGGRGDAPFTFFDYAGATTTRPLLYNRVIVTSPKDKQIHVDVLHAGAMKRTERDEDGEHVVDLVWDTPVVVPDEPFAPPLSEVVPLVVGSTFKNWDAFRKWYAEAVKGFTEPDEQVKRIAAELTKGKTTKDEKLKALFEFVADDIRYVNYVSGEWWLPNRPQQLLARREGDCDDKAILLISLLKAVGIEAQEVLVQTRQTNMPSVLKAPGAAVPQFDHGIAFLPGPNGGRYLDATSPQSRLGPIPSMDARAVALRMDGPAEIVELPNALPADHGSDSVWNIAVNRDGAAKIAGKELHMGDSAFFLRTALREEEGRSQYVEQNLIGGYFPQLSVDKGVGFQGDLSGGKSEVSYTAFSEAWGRKEGDALVLPLSASATLASTFAPSPSRLLPVELPSQLAPSHRTITFVVDAPKGGKWGVLPKGGTVEGGEFGKSSLTFSQQGDKITVKRTLIFDANKVPVAKYPAFRKFLLETDALMHKSLRLDVAHAEAPAPEKPAAEPTKKLPPPAKHGAGIGKKATTGAAK